MKEDSNHNTTSKENESHIESRRLNDFISVTIADEKEKKTSRMTENIIEAATSIEVFQLKLLQRSDEMTEFSNKKKTKKDSGNHLNITSKLNQDKMKRLPELGEKPETRIVNESNNIICNQTLLRLKEDSPFIKTPKEKERHNENIRSNESREVSATIEDDKDKTIPYMTANITEH